MTRFRKATLIAAKLLLSALLIAWLVRHASPAKIAAAIGEADPWLLSAVIPLVLVGSLVAAYQLKIFTDCHRMGVSLWRILGINFSTEFYNLFLPGYISGGAIRWYKLSRDNRMRAEAFAVIVLNRLLNTIVIVGLGLAGWLVDDNPQRNLYAGVFLAGLLALVMVVSLVLSRPATMILLRHRVLRHPRMKPWFRDKLDKLVSAAREFRMLSVMGHVKLVACSSAVSLLSALGTLMFLLALGASIPFAAILWMQALVGLAILLPVTISGFGIREGSWIYLLGLYGILPAHAFVLSILTFLRSLFKGMIGLVIEMRGLFAVH
jgi:uncharacterized protein (TIRG00374 family)